MYHTLAAQKAGGGFFRLRGTPSTLEVRLRWGWADGGMWLQPREPSTGGFEGCCRDPFGYRHPRFLPSSCR